MILEIALMLAAETVPGAWVQISRDREMTHFVDTRSVSGRGDRRTIRHRIRFATAQPGGTVNAVFEVEANCRAQTLALLGGYEQDRAGRIVERHRFSPARLYPVSSNSISERLLDFACDRSPQLRLRSLDLPALLLGDDPLWSQIYRNREQVHFVDAGHVKVVGDRKTVWHRVDFITPRPNGAVTILYNVELSCPGRLIATLRGTERDRAGRVLRSRDNPLPRLRGVIPNSVGEAIFNYFCEPSASR